MPGQRAAEDTRRDDILRAAYEVAAREGVEGLTIRAVATRVGVSHGTVLFHFRRRDELIGAILDRVLRSTMELRIPEAIARLSGIERLHGLLHAEMERVSADPRQFRLFLEYWGLGVRHPAIRRHISAALDSYRNSLQQFVDPVTGGDGIAAVAVSLIHGCALQAVIDPKGFDVHRHIETAARMLDRFAPDASAMR
jgi:TetR/AcrR family transcriptional regulator, transcriptional repressor of bet genes